MRCVAEAVYWLMTIGVVTASLGGFFFGFASLYTIYWRASTSTQPSLRAFP